MSSSILDCERLNEISRQTEDSIHVNVCLSLSLFLVFFFWLVCLVNIFSTFPSFIPLKVILHDVDAKICSEYRDVPVLKPPQPVSSWVRLFEKEKTRQQGNWPVSSILCQLKKNHSHTHISYAGFASKLKHAHCGDETHASKETYYLGSINLFNQLILQWK